MLPLVLLAATVATTYLAGGARFSFWVLLILGAHELGHYLACRIYRVPATLPHFIPGLPIPGFGVIPFFGTFGAFIRIRGIIPDRRVLFDIAAAGPLAGFAIALPLQIYGLTHTIAVEPSDGGLLFGQALIADWLYEWLVPAAPPVVAMTPEIMAAWTGMLVTSLNLFPVGQLDGGHVAYAWSRRFHRASARVALVALGGWIVWSLMQRQMPGYVLWFAVLLWMRDRHPPLLDEAVELDGKRRLLAVLLALIFVASLIPTPFVVQW